MSTPEEPSRFYATPAQIDAFLRKHFAEDVLLHFYRALGDEVLDEALRHGREFENMKQEQGGKHVYLAGMADVMNEMWDFRFYPARLPDMTGYTRPHKQPPPEPEPIKVVIHRVPGGYAAFQNNDPARTVGANATYDGLERHLGGLGRPVVVMSPAEFPGSPGPDLRDWNSPEDAAYDPPAAPEVPTTPCYRTKAHDAHDWLKGRRKVHCNGNPR